MTIAKDSVQIYKLANYKEMAKLAKLVLIQAENSALMFM